MQQILATFNWLFSKTIHVNTLYGIPIHVHLILLIFLPFFALDFISASPGSGVFYIQLLYGISYILILYASVLLHELGHAWGNYLVGGRTEMIVLLPIGGVAIGSGSDKSPKTELIVVGLGPAVSIVLAILGWVLFFVFQFLFSLTDFTTTNEIASGFVYFVLTCCLILGVLNTGLAMFNLLLPIFPMDSSKLLRAAFSLKYNPQRVTLFITKLGIGLAVFLILLWLTGIRLPIPYLGSGSIWLSIIALLGIQACLMEQQRIQHGDTYSAQDNWPGGRTHYYDSDALSLARRRAEASLGRLGFLVSVLFRKRSTTSTKSTPSKPAATLKKAERIDLQKKARVIDITDDLDPDTISDIEVLKKMMKTAANAENFPRAGKIQRRINELTKG